MTDTTTDIQPLSAAGFEFDMNDFTPAELEEIEERTGVGLADMASAPPMKIMTALIFVKMRRTDETFTWDQARHTKLGVLTNDPKASPGA